MPSLPTTRHVIHIFDAALPAGTDGSRVLRSCLGLSRARELETNLRGVLWLLPQTCQLSAHDLGLTPSQQDMYVQPSRKRRSSKGLSLHS